TWRRSRPPEHRRGHRGRAGTPCDGGRPGRRRERASPTGRRTRGGGLRTCRRARDRRPASPSPTGRPPPSRCSRDSRRRLRRPAPSAGACRGDCARRRSRPEPECRNPLCTPRLRALVGGDVYYYHGYTEMAVAGRWVKATPAFDRVLCDKFGVRPLEFDGRSDSLFHAYDRGGRRHMEYLRDHGAHADVPVDEIVATFAREYPRLMESSPRASDTQFRKEAEESA